ncbi:hypothetical protein [Pseudonocardia hierapolitana]|uniref:hypothetical protein n=1 Tax=Pseudonocardia hierapolitana TaxID=1128676 RepID=UPI0011BF985F|nr:hypothetical protein [Pseudonocardia hierapolitana]
MADRLPAAAGGSAVLSQQQVVSGLGRVGKTQLAAAFARTLQASRAVEVLIWVPASTRTSIVTGYAVDAHLRPQVW